MHLCSSCICLDGGRTRLQIYKCEHYWGTNANDILLIRPPLDWRKTYDFLRIQSQQDFFPIIAFLEGWIVSFRISMECITPYEFWKYSYEFISLSLQISVFSCVGAKHLIKSFSVFSIPKVYCSGLPTSIPCFSYSHARESNSGSQAGYVGKCKSFCFFRTMWHTEYWSILNPL
jgi:hypothetical protein